MHSRLEKQPVAYSEEPPLTVSAVRYVKKVLAVADMEMRKLRRDPSSLVMRGVQPALWLLVFGQVMAKARGIPTGALSYMDYLTPGILAQSMLFVAIFYGISVISERDLGIVHKFLVSPIPRTALVFGKALAGGGRALIQALIIYCLALTQDVHINWSPFAVLGVAGFVMLGAGLFSTLSLIIACIVKSRERFMGIGQVLTMPLFFASNAIYPTSVMPQWLQGVAHVNPLSYEVDGLRSLMIEGGQSAFGLPTDFAVLTVVLLVLVQIGGKMYPRIAY